MRRPITLRLAAALAIVASSACNCGTGPLQATEGVLALPQASLQFKNVCVGDSLSLPFTIYNDGRASLTIENLVISASAFAITPAQPLPVAIAPDSSLTLNITFTPPSTATAGENFAATLTITSNASMNPMAVATLEGNLFDGDPMYPKKFDVTCLCDRSTSDVACGIASVAADAAATPDDPCELLTYIDVPDGTAVSRTVTLVNQGCQPLTINASLYDSDNNSTSDANTQLFTVGAPSPITLQGGQSRQVTLSFNPTGTQAVSPNVRVKFLSDGENTIGTNTSPGLDDIGLIANSVVPELVVSPGALAFFNTAMGMKGTQTFTVSNAGNTPLLITSIAIQPTGTDFGLQLVNSQSSFTLAATSDPAGNDTRTETVTWTPTKPSTQQATVTITATGASASINLYGGIEPELTVLWALTSPTSALQPPPVNFGTTPTGATGLTANVQLSNTGSANLTVSAVATHDVTNTNPSTSFSTEGFVAGTLTPGQTMEFKVVFNDDVRIQNDEGKLDITSNDAVDVLNNGGVRVIDLLSTNTPDFPPIANICNPPETAMVCGSLAMDGSCTMAAAGQTGDVITYQWKMTAPAGSTAYLATPTDAMTQVSSMKAGCNGPDIAGMYTFTLTASDQYPGNTSPPISTTVNVQ